MTANKPMTGEQLDELMTVAVNIQRNSEKAGNRTVAVFAYAVQVAVLELRKVRDDIAGLAVDIRVPMPVIVPRDMAHSSITPKQKDAVPAMMDSVADAHLAYSINSSRVQPVLWRRNA